MYLFLPCLALPPAESPSTMKISASAGSVTVQSASLPGSAAVSRALLRRVSSRAFLAASLAALVSWHFCTILRAMGGFSSR